MILAIGILVLFFLIVRVKLNSFLALLLVADFVGIAEGLPVAKLIPTIEKGLGGTLGGLAIVVCFGAILGKLMAESGGAQRIATTLINVFGRKNVKWAVCLTGFIVGIALFYEIGFVLLIPLVFTIAAEAKIPLLEVGIPMAAALSVTHGFLPPHPGPTAIAIIYNADIGVTLVYGAIIAIPTAIVAGPVFYNFTKGINPEIPKGLYNPKIFEDHEMPGFGVSVFTALVPVVLMAASAIAKLALDQSSPVAVALEFLGQPDMALTIFDWSWDWGWDKSYGGIINFRDCRNLPVQDYSQDMKFWWPQCETIIASLYAYLATGDDEYIYRHQRISEWTYAHFPDTKYGEWYGYLHRDGRVAQPAKGNLFKGPFHIPRMMIKSYTLCKEILDKMG